MEHYYKDVPSGWFNYEEVYKLAIDRIPENTNAHFVELGVWFGQSMCFAGVEIIQSNKNIKLDGIDSFLNGDQPAPDSPEDTVRYSEALRYTDPVKNVVTLIKSDTHAAKDNYEDESLDFVFIDANHTYEGMMTDLVDWFPKVKKGGMIGGHDYEDAWKGLVQAVDEFFGKDNILHAQHSRSWYIYKN